MEDMSLVCSRLRRIRRERDVTQQELADFLGINRSNYSYYESGHTPLPLAYFCRLCVYFNVSADYLLGFKEERELYCISHESK